MLETVNPATGEVLATFPVHGRRQVDAAVAGAREAAVWWDELGWSGRRIRLLAWKSHLTRYMERLAQLVHEETGKPLDDARLEIILAILHIDWAAKHARRELGPRRVRAGLFSPPGGHGRVPAAGRGRRDRAVELPGVHPDGLDRVRAGRGQCGRVQAVRADPGHR